MPQPCKHNPPMYVPGEPYTKGRDCRQCWMYFNSESARASWDNDPNVTVISMHDSEKAKAALRAMGVTVTEPPPPPPIDQGPNWFQKMVNFTKAVVKHAWNGLPQTPTAEVERRIAICLECPLLNKDTGICTHHKCGCGVAKKTTWLMEQCPLEKW